MHDRDTRTALLQAAMAATTDAGDALEHQVRDTFEQFISRINSAIPAVQSPAPIEFDNSIRLAAITRVAALIASLDAQSRVTAVRSS
jgi:hypothetical protein